MRILISAYCCQPESGSEQGFGWWWVTKCSERHDVTVLTCGAQKDKITAYLRGRDLGIRFVFLRGPKRVSPSGTAYPFERLAQYIWQLRAVRLAKKLMREEHFEVAQHLTVGSWRQPSFLAFGPVPYVFGPTSGSEKVPPTFTRHLGLRGAVWEKLRGVLIFLAHFDPFVRLTLRRASILLAAGPATYRDFLKRYPEKTLTYTRVFPHPCLGQTQAKVEVRRQPTSTFVISSVGQLIPRKGFRLLLQALSDRRLNHAELKLIGDGPERPKLERLARDLMISGRVSFLGQLEQREAFRLVRESDLFVFPSFQDMMGQALSEAMQLGVPCVVLDWSGPAQLAGDNGAYRVKIGTYKKTCSNLADAIALLSRNDALRRRLAEDAQTRIKDLADPDSIAKNMDEIYARAAARPWSEHFHEPPLEVAP